MLSSHGVVLYVAIQIPTCTPPFIVSRQWRVLQQYQSAISCAISEYICHQLIRTKFSQTTRTSSSVNQVSKCHVQWAAAFMGQRYNCPTTVCTEVVMSSLVLMEGLKQAVRKQYIGSSLPVNCFVNSNHWMCKLFRGLSPKTMSPMIPHWSHDPFLLVHAITNA